MPKEKKPKRCLFCSWVKWKKHGEFHNGNYYIEHKECKKCGLVKEKIVKTRF